ncbi:MAG: hypothetical protein JWQ38_1710, partial [Flavipsychrobacter sp.]|nr:hypothetical protein [Flavipsychrobacter sp.]
GLSVISGYLMSKASWLGRVGMTFFYKEYNLLKIWWQGAIAVFIVLLLLFALHSVIQARMKFLAAKTVHLLIMLLAFGGLYLTYDDFTNELTHNLLGWRFHYGFYLFWVDWMLICFFFLFKKKPKTDFPIDPNSKATTAQ